MTFLITFAAIILVVPFSLYIILEVIKVQVCREWDHVDKKGFPKDQGKSFDKREKVFHYNKEKNILEDREEFIDVDEQVNSCKDMSMQAILNRFLPGDEIQEGVMTVEDYEDDLDRLAYFAENAEEFKERYQLDPGLSIDQVFQEVGKKAQAFKDDLAKRESQKTEGVENAQVVQESEQA